MSAFKGFRTFLGSFAVAFLAVLESFNIETFATTPLGLVLIAALFALLRVVTTTPAGKKE